MFLNCSIWANSQVMMEQLSWSLHDTLGTVAPAANGRPDSPKRINFWKSFKWGGESFAYQKFMLHIFLYIEATQMSPFRQKSTQKIPEIGQGRVSRAVWNFSENSSILVAACFPYQCTNSDPSIPPLPEEISFIGCSFQPSLLLPTFLAL